MRNIMDKPKSNGHTTSEFEDKLALDGFLIFKETKLTFDERPTITIQDKNKLAEEHGGMKFCKGKNRLGLMIKGFAPAILELGVIATKGAEKYADNSWQEVPDAVDKYRDALYRHMLAWDSGEELDPEFGTHHLIHAMWNAAALYCLTRKE